MNTIDFSKSRRILTMSRRTNTGRLLFKLPSQNTIRFGQSALQMWIHVPLFASTTAAASGGRFAMLDKTQKFKFIAPSPRILILPQPGIYAIVNRENNYKYVGQSGNILQRIKSHQSSLRRGYHLNPSLASDLKLFGVQAFYFVVIEYLNINELNAREAYWIKILNAEYNISAGRKK